MPIMNNNPQKEIHDQFGHEHDHSEHEVHKGNVEI